MTALLCTEVVAMKAAGVETAAPATTVTSDEVVTDEKSKGAYEQLKELLVSDKQQQSFTNAFPWLCKEEMRFLSTTPW